MSLLRTTILGGCAALALAVPAAASGASFGPSEPIGLTITGPIATSLGAGGEAAVGGLDGSRPDGTFIALATRTGAGAPWQVGSLGPVSPQARDVQVVVTRGRAVVAWAQARDGDDDRVVVASGPLGGKLAVRRRFAIANAYSASPRLARLSNGTVVVAWRDGTFRAPARVRVARFDGDRLGGGPWTVGRDAAQVELAARGSSASVGWTSSYHVRPGTHAGSPRRALPRTLTVASLDRRGAPAGRPVIVGRDVGAVARLAGASDGRLVASWARPTQIRPYAGEDRGVAPPPGAYVFPRAFTRQVLPALRPARPVGGADQVAQGPPSVAFDGPDHALTVVRAAGQAAGPLYDALGAGSSAGGPWSDPLPVAHLGFTRLDPIALAPAPGDAVVVYTALDPTIGAPRWIVAATDAAGAHRLGTTTGDDGRSATATGAGARVLVAWDDGGQIQVAERG
jgi:hypothetical protein